MTRSRAAVLLATLVVIAGCDSLDRDPDQDCTLVGCDSYVLIELGAFPASQFHDQPPYADVEVCLNARCEHVIVDKYPEIDESVYTRVGNFVPGPEMVVGLHAKASSDIDMTVSVRAQDGTIFHDGDICRVTFRRMDGSVVASGSWSVAYKTSYPNGRDCEPTCRQSMTLTPI
jgi:hypothetical protein